MGKIFIIMGKSGTGKSTIYKYLLEHLPVLHKLKYGTTRPKRDENDNEYEFVSKDTFDQLLKEDKILEWRKYNTEYGEWYYFTYKSDIDLSKYSYIMVGTLDVFRSMKQSFDRDDLVPIMIEVPNEEERIKRIINERTKRIPISDKERIAKEYNEIERRIKQDAIDFSTKRMLIFRTDLLFHEGAVVENNILLEVENYLAKYITKCITCL